MSRRRVLAAAAAGFAALVPQVHGRAAAGAAPRAPFAFALIGDLPYSDTDEANLVAMIDDIGRDALEFVIHVGDIKSGREPCDDALFARRGALLARSTHPLVLLPGDNEWTDCGRPGAGGHAPLERLDALRTRFWSTPAPLGGTHRTDRAALVLRRQPGRPENVRWRVGAVAFVGLNVVGSDNGVRSWPGSRADFVARRDANRGWLLDATRDALADGADALVVAFHADPGFDRGPTPGFSDWIRTLQDVAAAFPRPILLLHGDTHRFRADRPLLDRDGRPVAHVQRVECFGWPFTSSWVRIAYDPDAPERFRVAIREVVPPGR